MPVKIQDYQIVVDLWEEHQDTAIVAKKLRIARGYVSTILRERFGIHVPRNMKTKYNLPMEEIKRRYLAGETCGEIAVDYGIPSERIRRRLRAIGVERRSAAESVPRGEKNIFYKDGQGRRYKENKYQSKKAAAAYLGKPIQSWWVVHHADENPQNLDPENMMIFPSLSHHSAYHTRRLSRQKKGLEADAIQMGLENGGLTLSQLRDGQQFVLDIGQPDPLDTNQ